MNPAERSPDPPPLYGDYPELFWDLDSTAPVDPEQPSVLARILTMAEIDIVWKLAPKEIVRREIRTLAIPEHVRRFWEMMFDFPARRPRRGDPRYVRAPEPRPVSDPPRYGDYPELFWDLRPDEPITVEHPAVLGRILASGSLEMIRALVPFDTIRRNLDKIEAPEHVRRFWKLVVQHRDASLPSTPQTTTARRPG